MRAKRTRPGVAVASPFCRIMPEDALGAQGGEDLVIWDVAEIMADGLVS
jgi:hypothetical protein